MRVALARGEEFVEIRPEAARSVEIRRNPPAPVAGLVANVARATGIAVAAILAPRRGRLEAAFARQVAMYLAAVDLELSQAAVGRAFGRHRSTVAHAVALVEDRRDDPAFDAWLAAVEGRLAAKRNGSPR